MNATTLESGRQCLPTGEDWDILRVHFQDSVMGAASLCSLAANLGLKWPIRGKDETPGRYSRFTLQELAEMPEFYGKGSRIPLLYTILLETKRLEEPFEEMTRHLGKVAPREADAPPLLGQLGIPADFPVDLVNFSDRTHALCREGGHATIGQLAGFLRDSATAVIINDEFRQFRLCLDQMDAAGLRRFLPLRHGERGVFLAEAIGHAGRRLSDAEAATIVYAYRIATTNPAWGEDAVMARAEALALIARVKGAVLRCLDLLPDQARELRAAVDSGMNACIRFFVPLGDPALEGLCIAMTMAALDAKPRIKGLLGNWLA